MTTQQYTNILQEARRLGLEEQRQLLADLAELVRQAEDQTIRPDRSILELDGLGKVIWAGVDPDHYIRGGAALVGWLAPLHGELVGIDTAPLIYYIEQYPAFYPTVRPFFEAVAHSSFSIVTSMVSLTGVRTISRSGITIIDRK